MGAYIVRRLLQSIIVVIGVTLVSFLALQAGGDPTYLFVSERASAEEIEATRIALGFDRPLHEQYLSFVADLTRGDFGQSLSYRQPAMEIVLEALPATIELTFFAMLLALLLAIPLGVLAAINRGTAGWLDHNGIDARPVDPQFLDEDHDDPVFWLVYTTVPDFRTFRF